MGPDAMLVNSKRTGVEARHLGAYEVVVCAEKTECGRKTAEIGATAPLAGFALHGSVCRKM